MSAGLITLLTDFGLKDEYVGVMKGVIACRAPNVALIDLCHQIPAQDIRGAAYLLEASYYFFPKGSVHLCVVDPGVGSSRRLLAAEFNGQRFVTPDNGLLTFLLDEAGLELYELVCQTPVCATFPGRDVLAPVAAFLAAGGELAGVGLKLDRRRAVRFEGFRPAMQADGQLQGQIIWRDHFGNLVTNIGKKDLIAYFGGMSDLWVILNDQTFALSKYYAAVETGRQVALINSRGYLELAQNGGNLAQALGLTKRSLQSTVMVKKILPTRVL